MGVPAPSGLDLSVRDLTGRRGKLALFATPVGTGQKEPASPLLAPVLHRVVAKEWGPQ